MLFVGSVEAKQGQEKQREKQDGYAYNGKGLPNVALCPSGDDVSRNDGEQKPVI